MKLYEDQLFLFCEEDFRQENTVVETVQDNTTQTGNKWVVYVIRNHINNKVYVGQKKLTGNVLGYDKYFGSGYYLHEAIKKYGKQHFSKTTLEECFTYKDINEAERKWIRFYDSTNRNKGYNRNNGGNQHQWTEEQRQKQIAYNNRMKNNEEYIRKQREHAIRGNANLTEEQKRRRVESARQTRLNRTEEQKQATREKLRLARQKKVEQERLQFEHDRAEELKKGIKLLSKEEIKANEAYQHKRIMFRRRTLKKFWAKIKDIEKPRLTKEQKSETQRKAQLGKHGHNQTEEARAFFSNHTREVHRRKKLAKIERGEFVGVRYSNRERKWVASYSYYGKHTERYAKTELEAAIKYNEMVLKYGDKEEPLNRIPNHNEHLKTA